jgi:hypothetical protein
LDANRPIGATHADDFGTDVHNKEATPMKALTETVAKAPKEEPIAMSAEQIVTEFEAVWEWTSTPRLLLLDPNDRIMTWQLKEKEVKKGVEREHVNTEHATNVTILSGKMAEGFVPIGIVGLDSHGMRRRYVDCGHRPQIETAHIMDAFQEGWDTCEW